jgi:hypothetical protein
MEMPRLSKQIEKRLADLLSNRPGSGKSSATPVGMDGWMVSAASVVEAVVTKPLHPYRHTSSMSLASYQFEPERALRSMLGMLQQLKVDFEAGLLSDLEAQFSAQALGDLLNHAEEYLRHNRREPAGLLAGVVFEDTVRRLCGKHNVTEVGVRLDTLLAELVKAGALTPLERRECDLAAGLRTSATHARWEEFDARQVETVLSLTRRLMSEKLAP